MFCSRACGYAIQALGQLALLEPGGSAMVQQLCEELKLPRYFVAKIFQRLVREGILISRKGRGGGFSLARPANRIRLIDVVIAIDGQDRVTQCPVGHGECHSQQPCSYHDYWAPLRDEIHRYLESSTLADLKNSQFQMPCQGNDLDGLRVLVVEDSFLVGNALGRMISRMGCEVLGPVPTIDAAVEALDGNAIDGAVLDIEMGGVTSAPIAERLVSENRPFFFISGYSNMDMLPSSLRSCRRLSKPIDEQALRMALIEEMCQPAAN